MVYLGKLSLVLADNDEDYIGSLSNYLIMHHAQSFEIHTFTCVESLTAFFSGSTRRVNILLAGPGFIDAGIPEGSADVSILLDDGKTGSSREGMNVINRYQHAEKLVAAIFGIYSGKSAAGRLPAGKNSTHIAAFISPSGGTGKSVIAAGCSLLCSRRGMKAFYLNLEDTASTGLYFKGNSDQNLSNVIYFLKDKESNPDIKLAGARCADVSNGVHFFLPPESPLEMSCLLPGDMKMLIDSFRLAAVYDAVFVDMPGRLDECGIAAINASDQVVCIYGSDSTSRFKSQSLHAELELLERRHISGLMEKTIFVENDSRGLGLDSCLNSANRKPAVVFEECDALRSVTCGNGLLDCGVNFTSGISMLLEKINPEWAIRRCGQAGGKTFEG